MRIGGLPPLPSETFKELEKLEEQKYKKLKAQNSTFYGKPIMNDYGKQIMNSQFVIERMLYLKYEIEEMKKFIREYQELDENNLRRRAQLLCTLKVMVDLIVSSQYFGVGRPGPDYVYSWEATSSSVDYEKFIYGPLGRRRTKYQWAVGELEPGIVAPYNAAQDNIEKFKEFGEFQNFFEDELINIEYLTMFALANSDKGLIREELDTMIRYA
jgi:mRNA-degrading endonuclease RelE of RelBE toxin-antitoxin system